MWTYCTDGDRTRVRLRQVGLTWGVATIRANPGERKVTDGHDRYEDDGPTRTSTPGQRKRRSHTGRDRSPKWNEKED